MALAPANRAATGSGIDGTVYASGSFTPTVGRKLLVPVGCSKASAPEQPTMSVTGFTTGAWTKEADITEAGDAIRLTVWSAKVATSAAGTVVATFATTHLGCNVIVDEFNGGDDDIVVDTNVDTDDEPTGTSASITLPNALASADNAIYVACMINANEAQAPAGSETELGDVGHASPTRHLWTGWLVNSQTAGCQWTSSVSQILAAGMEIRAAASGQTIAVGQASETDSALAMTAAKQAAAGLASETDTAQTITAVKAAAVGQATETDTAQPITAVKTAEAGVASETDSALSITAAKSAGLGQASETDEALPITAVKVVPVGIASETDAALPITVPGVQTVAVETAEEIDTALPIVAVKVVPVGIAEETNTSQPVAVTKTLDVGVATETDTAQPILAAKAITVGIATETDQAQPFAGSKIFLVGLATEADLALALVLAAQTAVRSVTASDRGAGSATATDRALATVGSDRTTGTVEAGDS